MDLIRLESIVGYQVFALCIRQVLNNWRMTLRISWFWLLLIAAAGILHTAAAAGLGSALAGSTPSSPPILISLLSIAWFVLIVFGFCTVAIAWHRYVLRNEIPSTFYVLQRGWSIGGYFWKTVKIALIFFALFFVFVGLPIWLLGFPAVFGFLGLTDVGTVPAPGSLILLFAVSIAYSTIGVWIFLRLGTCLPAIAVGNRMTLAESFRLTRPFARQLFTTAILISLFQAIPSVVQSFATVAFGSEVVVLNIVVVVMALVFSWINTFVGIGVLTVIYGHLAENRPI